MLLCIAGVATAALYVKRQILTQYLSTETKEISKKPQNQVPPKYEARVISVPWHCFLCQALDWTVFLCFLLHLVVTTHGKYMFGYWSSVSLVQCSYDISFLVPHEKSDHNYSIHQSYICHCARFTASFFFSHALTISFLQTACQYSITDVHLGISPFTAVMAIFSTREQSSISTWHVYTIQNIAANLQE
jgi:hypothetical protein